MFTIIFRFQNYCDIEKLYSQVDLICLRSHYLNSHSDEFSGWLPERKHSVLAVINSVNTKNTRSAKPKDQGVHNPHGE